MKLSHNRAWWCGLTLPLLSVCGCRSSDNSAAADDLIVPSPNTSISRLGSIYRSSQPTYWVPYKGTLNSIEPSAKIAREIVQTEELLDENTRRQISSISALCANGGMQLQASLVAELKSDTITPQQAAAALKKLAASSARLLDALLVRVKEIGAKDPALTIEADRLFNAGSRYQHAGNLNGYFFPNLLLECFPFIDAVKAAGFPGREINFVDIISTNAAVSAAIDKSIVRFLQSQVALFSGLNTYLQHTPELQTPLQEFLNDPTSAPKYSVAYDVVHETLKRTLLSQQARVNRAVISQIGITALSRQQDLEQASCIPMISTFLARIESRLALNPSQLRSISARLLNIDAHDSYLLREAISALENASQYEINGAQENFNNGLAPLIAHLVKVNSQDAVIESLYSSLRNSLLPNDYWPTNVQVISTSGIAYNDWDKTNSIIESMRIELDKKRAPNDSSGSILNIFKQHFPNVINAWKTPDNLGAAASPKFNDLVIANRYALGMPALRVLFIAGRDYRSSATSQGEGFLNLANSINSGFEFHMPLTSDILFASSPTGVCDMLSNLGANESGEKYVSGDQREDLLIILIGLGRTGPQLLWNQNVGAMFDGSIILKVEDLSSGSLDEYSLKRALQTSSKRFNSVTLMVLGDAGAAFIE